MKQLERARAKEWVKVHKKVIKAMLKITDTLSITVPYGMVGMDELKLELLTTFPDHFVSTNVADDEHFMVSLEVSK